MYQTYQKPVRKWHVFFKGMIFFASKNFWIFHSQKKNLEQLVVPADESELLLNGRKEKREDDEKRGEEEKKMRREKKQIDREKT